MVPCQPTQVAVAPIFTAPKRSYADNIYYVSLRIYRVLLESSLRTLKLNLPQGPKPHTQELRSFPRAASRNLRSR